jgi:CheY-like chemotaxis protein
VIRVESQLGVGTSFQIYLPAATQVVLDSVAVEGAIDGAGVILVVDDEEFTRLTAKRLLESLGYEVYTAADGVEALRMLESSQRKVDLVVLDLIMPKMNGLETFNRIRQIEPTTKIIVASGYSKEDELREMRERGLDGFIWKPFGRTELSRIVAEVLEKPVS